MSYASEASPQVLRRWGRGGEGYIGPFYGEAGEANERHMKHTEGGPCIGVKSRNGTVGGYGGNRGIYRNRFFCVKFLCHSIWGGEFQDTKFFSDTG